MGRFKNLLIHSEDGVQTITLNRPEKRNALSAALIEELTMALHDAEACDCGVVILTGAGSAFCAGLDLEQIVGIMKDDLPRRLDRDCFDALIESIMAAPAPRPASRQQACA